MEQEIAEKFQALEQRVVECEKAAHQTRKYFMWLLIISVAVIVLPLIGLMFVIPQFLSTYSNAGL